MSPGSPDPSQLCLGSQFPHAEGEASGAAGGPGLAGAGQRGHPGTGLARPPPCGRRGPAATAQCELRGERPLSCGLASPGPCRAHRGPCACCRPQGLPDRAVPSRLHRRKLPCCPGVTKVWCAGGGGCTTGRTSGRVSFRFPAAVSRWSRGPRGRQCPQFNCLSHWQPRVLSGVLLLLSNVL